MTLPEEDKSYITKGEMFNQVIHLLGGRVAEQLVLEDISTGASNDIERATDIARNMVTRYGMSDKIGPVNYSSEDEVFLGRDFSTKKNISEAVTSEIDHEIRRIIEAAYSKTTELLKEHMDKLHVVAEGLLELETLDAEQFERLFNGESVENLKNEYREKIEKLKKEREAARAKAEEQFAQESKKILMGQMDPRTGKYAPPKTGRAENRGSADGRTSTSGNFSQRAGQTAERERKAEDTWEQDLFPGNDEANNKQPKQED